MDVQYTLELTTTLVVGFLALLFATNMLGKTQISQATPFHFISALVLGELLGNGVYDDNVGIFQILYTIFIWTFLMFIIEIVTQKFRKTRNFFEGKPSIVINKGKIDYKELKKNRMDLNELQSLLRQKGLFSIKEVEYAILESNGSISVLKKWQYDQPTNQTLNLNQENVALPITLISDGEVITDNLNILNFDIKWLNEQLKARNIHNLKEVCYAEWDISEGLYVSTK